MSHFSFMYFLQVNGGQITFSCRTVNPKSIHETFKESLMRIFMKHVQQDPVYGSWQFLTSGVNQWENSYSIVRFLFPTKLEWTR